MSDSRTHGAIEHAGGLDPEICVFVQRMSQGWSEHPPLNQVSFPEARRIAEQVRAPWTKGGPPMAHRTEKSVPLAHGAVRIRILNPGEGGTRPALIYLHGGGWTIFSIETHDRLMREYAARANLVVVAVDYSLSPESRFPRAIEETVAVVDWVQTHGSEHGIDGRRIAIGGDSAGAAMTIAACLKLRDAGEPRAVKAMLLNYGAFDATCATESYRRYGQGGYMWGSGEMAAFWNNYLGDPSLETNPLACPIHADVRGLPPAFLAIPECDVMYDECIQMGNKLRRARVAAQSVIYPETTHSFLEAVSIARIANRAFDEASGWLSDMLRGGMIP
ncbi:MAG: alpha/beta hydrolase [Proteobacteria bacterium]|nr:alpha/beta hydrolase [Pseudomonadota bacterium]